MKRKLTVAGLVLLGATIVAVLILANLRTPPEALPAQNQIIVTTGGSVVISPEQRVRSRPTVVASWPGTGAVTAVSNSAAAAPQAR